jgi:NADH-quinone oxidoreductase subunit E
MSNVFDTPKLNRTPVPPLSERFHEDARAVIARYPEGQARSALLPLLYLVQVEHGYVSPDGIAHIATLLGLTKAEVAGVATFYTMFKRAPQGKWLLSVCTQPACALAGAGEVKRALEGELGIVCGQTAGDISIEEVECLCECDAAPVVSVNYENYGGVTPEQALEIVRGLRAGEAPPPALHGEVPGDFAAVNRSLSGVEAPR